MSLITPNPLDTSFQLIKAAKTNKILMLLNFLAFLTVTAAAVQGQPITYKGDNIEVVVSGNGNVPKYKFKAIGENTEKTQSTRSCSNALTRVE